MSETHNDRMPLFPPAHDFEFRNPRIDVGWLLINHVCLGNEYDLVASSHVRSDPLAAIIVTCIELHGCYRNNGHGWDTFREYGFNDEWEGEPCRYDWSFWPRTGGILNVRLTYREDTEIQHGVRVYPLETLFECSITYETLLKQWYNVSKTLLSDNGLMGFKNNWIMHEFPLRDFRELHCIVTGEEHTPAHGIDDDIAFLSRFVKNETT